MKKYMIVCPTWKRWLYKISGMILGIILITLNILFPKVFSEYHHFTLSGMGACIWLITRAGYKKEDNENEKD